MDKPIRKKPSKTGHEENLVFERRGARLSSANCARPPVR
jgi:hypothetical protein